MSPAAVRDNKIYGFSDNFQGIPHRNISEKVSVFSNNVSEPTNLYIKHVLIVAGKDDYCNRDFWKMSQYEHGEQVANQFGVKADHLGWCTSGGCCG